MRRTIYIFDDEKTKKYVVPHHFSPKNNWRWLKTMDLKYVCSNYRICDNRWKKKKISTRDLCKIFLGVYGHMKLVQVVNISSVVHSPGSDFERQLNNSHTFPECNYSKCYDQYLPWIWVSDNSSAFCIVKKHVARFFYFKKLQISNLSTHFYKNTWKIPGVEERLHQLKKKQEERECNNLKMWCEWFKNYRCSNS